MNRAFSDLCGGGRSVMGVPTAIPHPMPACQGAPWGPFGTIFLRGTSVAQARVIKPYDGATLRPNPQVPDRPGLESPAQECPG